MEPGREDREHSPSHHTCRSAQAALQWNPAVKTGSTHCGASSWSLPAVLQWNPAVKTGSTRRRGR